VPVETEAAPPTAEEAPPSGEEAETIKIGLDLPVSGPGGTEGQSIQRGAELAFDEINAAGGVNGHMLELIVGDNQCDSAVGVSALRSLIEVDRVHVTLGSSCSSVSLAVMDILEEEKVASLDVTATNPGITQQAGPAGGNIWKFRLNLNDLLMNEEFATRVIAQEVDSVALMVTNTDYGRGVVEVVNTAIPEIVVTEEYFALGDADFRPQLTSIKALDPEAIMIIGDYTEASKIIIQMYELGLDQRIYGRGSVVTENTLELLPEEAKPLFEGAKEVVFYAITPENAELAENYGEKFGETFNRDNGMGYFGMQVLAEAIKNCGDFSGDLVADRACIREGLAEVSMDIPGIGHIEFDDHHQAHYPMFITTIQDGEAVVIDRVPTD
jgi:branched-chain amino acid transport system substrate-binding protein